MKATEKDIIKALEKSAGFITVAAKKLNMTHQAILYRIKHSKNLKAKKEEIDEGMKDFAESKLFKAIKADASWAICFYLKCKAKDRGYVERQELTGKGGKDVKITVTGV